MDKQLLMQRLIINIICLTCLGLLIGVIGLVFLMNDIVVPEGFVGLIVGWQLMPRFRKRLGQYVS